MTPVHLLQFEVRGFLFGLTAVLGYKMLTRNITLNGLLNDENSNRNISPERVQLLLATIAMGSRYIGQVSQSTGVTALPDISPNWLYMFGGSTGIYMAMNAFKTLRKTIS
jgi:hypothetical protein